VQSSPRFWTANVEPFSKNCHDRVKPINHSTKLCLAGIVPSFCVRAECHGLLRRFGRLANPVGRKIPLVQVMKHVVTCSSKVEAGGLTLKFTMNTSKLNLCLPGEINFKFIVYYTPLKSSKQAKNHPQCCSSGDESAFIRGSKHRCESACNQFETKNLHQH